MQECAKSSEAPPPARPASEELTLVVAGEVHPLLSRKKLCCLKGQRSPA